MRGILVLSSAGAPCGETQLCRYSNAEIEAASRLESALSDPVVLNAVFDRNSRSTIIFENEYELAGWLGQIASVRVTVRALSQAEAEAAVGYVREVAGTEGPNALVRLEPPTHQIMTAIKNQDTISEDDTQRFQAGVALAAVEIADGCPPEWFTSGLYALAGEIARGFRSDARYPKGHKEFRDKLEAVVYDAELLSRRDDLDETIRVGLCDIIRKIRAALERIARKQGRGKCYLGVDQSLPTLREKDVCALVVCVAWQLIRRQWPGVKNVRAHRVCDTLWGAVGGDVKRQSNIRNKESPPENSIWVRHLKAVKIHQNGDKALQIERILVLKRPPMNLAKQC